MGLRHFGDQPMPAQQPQLSSHRRHLPTLLPFVLGRCVESNSHIAIAKTIDGKLSSVDCCQQLSVSFPQRIECSIPLSLPPHRSTHLGCFLGKRALPFARRQRRQMSIGGFAANFGSPTEISHTAPKHSPLFFTRWLIPRSTPNSKVFRLVDRHLVAQHTPLVVKLKRVFVQPMLDPHSHTSTAPIRNHFVVDPHSSRAPHIPHHLLGSKTHHRMMHQPRIDPLKGFSIAKHHVGGVLALSRRPVVLPLNRPADLLVKWMTLFDQPSQYPRPVRSLLLFHQLLGSPHIADPRKTVLLSTVGHPRFVHLPPQPFPPVHTDLYQKGKPRLERPLQPQSIPPVQYPDHIVLVTFYECSPHLVLQQIVSVCSHASHLHHGSAYVTLVAAFAALGSLRLNLLLRSGGYLPSFNSRNASFK